MKTNPDNPGRISANGDQAPDQRRSWYTPAAQAYNRARPGYPDALVDQAIKEAGLWTDAHILEIGCGPGTATLSFAERDFAIIGIANPELCGLARENCKAFPKVEIINVLFEEWPLEAGRFDAVLAATSFHWVSPGEGYPKVARALKDHGCLILLWNTALQLAPELHGRVRPIFERYAPGLFNYESVQVQEQAIEEQGRMAVASGYFEKPTYHQLRRERTVTADEYAELLSTYTPYLKLGRRAQEALLDGLKEVIRREPGDSVRLSFISALQVFRKTGA